MKIVEFAFIIYQSTDQARSRAFYEGVLELTNATSINDGSQIYVEYEIGPHTLGIGNEPFLKPSGDGPHLVLEVDDFDKTIEHLGGHNVPFAVKPFDMPGCRAAIVLDPADKNSAFINERPNQPVEPTVARLGSLGVSGHSRVAGSGGCPARAPVANLYRSAK